METCPCCSNVLLRHIRNHRIYWFCHHCWQEMPPFHAMGVRHQYRQSLENIFNLSETVLAKV